MSIKREVIWQRKGIFYERSEKACEANDDR
jgi:hypothetical protein